MAIVAGHFNLEQEAWERAREFEQEAAQQGIRWQELTGLPMPWTNGTVNYSVLSVADLARGRSLGIAFWTDPNPYPVLPELDDWEIKHNLATLRRNRYFLEPEVARQNWARFYSCDRRFRLSVSFPAWWADPRVTFFDMSRDTWVVADFDTWVIVREDLRLLGERGDALARAILREPGRLSRLVRDSSQGPTRELSPVAVGSSDTLWPRIRGKTRGPSEAVIVLDSAGGLWHFGRPPDSDEATYCASLRSVACLTDEFYDALDRRFARLDFSDRREAHLFGP
jgi:hypothetical protein